MFVNLHFFPSNFTSSKITLLLKIRIPKKIIPATQAEKSFFASVPIKSEFCKVINISRYLSSKLVKKHYSKKQVYKKTYLYNTQKSN